MLKRELAFAAIAAAVLTAGTVKAAHGLAAGCMETCREAFGSTFFELQYWMDDDNSINPPGEYNLTNCTEVADTEGSTTTCYYSHTI